MKPGFSLDPSEKIVNHLDEASRKEEGDEEEMVGWHHQIDGRKFEQALGVGDGQGSLACCSPWGCK